MLKYNFTKNCMIFKVKLLDQFSNGRRYIERDFVELMNWRIIRLFGNGCIVFMHIKSVWIIIM